MAESAPTVNLNKAWLQNFLDNDVIPFADELRKMGLEGTAPGDSTLTVPALVDLEEGEAAGPASSPDRTRTRSRSG